MPELIFFYGTLMTPFNRTARLRIDRHLTFKGAGTIEGALFDLGIYPAAIPSADSRVNGEVYRMSDGENVLAVLDELEGHRPTEPDTSLYRRIETPVTMGDGRVAQAWVYFYNAPLGQAQRIESGDYLDHLKMK